ncbi:hypothetical protein [Endozoicomonas sp.]|uniref:hypothetical protein n=1 Tax=Endozoicomonas sp. TaxID=1892382 RepID=UPI003AF6563A
MQLHSYSRAGMSSFIDGQCETTRLVKTEDRRFLGRSLSTRGDFFRFISDSRNKGLKLGDVVTSVQGQGIFDRKLKIQKEDGVDELDCVDAAIRPAEYKAENSAGFGNERESLFPRMERELDELKNLFTRLLASESVHRPSDVGGVIGLTESTIQQEGGLDGDVATGRPAEYKAENSAGFGNEIEPLFTRMEGDLDELKNSFTRLCTSEGEHKASYVEGVIDLAKSTASTLDNFNLIISSIDSKDSNKENIKFTGALSE